MVNYYAEIVFKFIKLSLVPFDFGRRWVDLLTMFYKSIAIAEQSANEYMYRTEQAYIRSQNIENVINLHLVVELERFLSQNEHTNTTYVRLKLYRSIILCQFMFIFSFI